MRFCEWDKRNVTSLRCVHIITPHSSLTQGSFQNPPTAGKGTNLCIIILVAGLSLLAFWMSRFSPTCQNKVTEMCHRNKSKHCWSHFVVSLNQNTHHNILLALNNLNLHFDTKIFNVHGKSILKANVLLYNNVVAVHLRSPVKVTFTEILWANSALERIFWCPWTQHTLTAIETALVTAPT